MLHLKAARAKTNLKSVPGTFIPGFEEQLVGAETDADVDVKGYFP